MLKTTKVFLIIGLVAGSLYGIGNAAQYLFNGNTVAAVVMIIVAVIVMIVCSLGLVKISKARKKADISTAFCVLTLIFGNLIAGILMLKLKDEDFIEKYGKQATPAQTGEDTPFFNDNNSGV